MDLLEVEDLVKKNQQEGDKGLGSVLPGSKEEEEECDDSVSISTATTIESLSSLSSSNYFSSDREISRSSSNSTTTSSSSSISSEILLPLADIMVPAVSLPSSSSSNLNLISSSSPSTTPNTSSSPIGNSNNSNNNGGDDGGLTVRGCVGKKNKYVTWGFSSIIGRRKEMEDALCIIPGFISNHTCRDIGGCTAPSSRVSSEIQPVHFFGVYDGHGGSQVAKFCAERIHDTTAEEWERGGMDVDTDVNGWHTRWETAFSRGFERADNEVAEESVAPEIVGSTAVVVALSGCQIITSNCGDSRAVLCRGTQTIPLSIDHKPDREDELARIEGAGGRVISWNGARVFGVLAMSRSIGTFTI
ncbi:hypothetical protein MKW92_008302 [Papaver armeniacum]|nr:hypothetical protein MKW92_008302 [Papaver armeniacum]